MLMPNLEVSNLFEILRENFLLLNSFVHGRSGSNSKSMVFKSIKRNSSSGTCYEIAFM